MSNCTSAVALILASRLALGESISLTTASKCFSLVTDEKPSRAECNEAKRLAYIAFESIRDN